MSQLTRGFELVGVDLPDPEVPMLIEETPSGNLCLFVPARRDAGVRITREDIQAVTEVFEILDRWDREAQDVDADLG